MTSSSGFSGRQVPEWLQAARDQWAWTGDERPDYAIEPGPGQESVWDYPRPPGIAADSRHIEVIGQHGLIASTTTSIRVMETSHPPSFYLPPDAITTGALVTVPGSSHCEWKGPAEYVAEPGGQQVGWRYPNPYEEFADYRGWVSFYPDRVTCKVDGEVARAQHGGFYGGWITDELVGPFKGDVGLTGI